MGFKKIVSLALLITTHLVAIESPFLTFSNMPASYVKDMISQGQVIYRAIQNGSVEISVLKANPVRYLKDIISLVFYFYAQAIQKGQGFSSGTFVIQDPEFKVYNFLYEYVASRWKPRNMTKELIIDMRDIGAYPRKSTHFNELYLLKGVAKKGIFGGITKNAPYIHYGIDIPNNLPLPVHKKHILFGKVQNNPPLIFLKIEEHGLDKKGFFQHAVDLTKSQTKKFLAKTSNQLKKLGFNQEGYVGKLLEQLSSVTSDDKADARRERIPLNALTKFLAILCSPGSPVKKENIEIKPIKGLGIQRMLTVADHLIKSEKGSQEWRKALIQFADQLRKEYDHTSIRFGREVILTPDSELKN